MKELIEILNKRNAQYEVKDEEISIGGYLDLRGTAITILPDNLNVGGSLDLEGTAITILPDNLSVGGSLYLRGTAITILPDNLSVGGSLYLNPEHISNTAYRQNCGEEKRTIFAAWVNSALMIAAGCFLGTIEEFETAVDEKYTGDAAEAYKKAGRECVAELREKLKRGEHDRV